MKRIQWVCDRLEAWQVWAFSPGGVSSYLGALDKVKVDCELSLPSVISATDSDAIKTDRAVAALPTELKLAVTTMYLTPQARSLCAVAGLLRISRQMLHKRLCYADLRIAEHLTSSNDE